MKEAHSNDVFARLIQENSQKEKAMNWLEKVINASKKLEDAYQKAGETERLAEDAYDEWMKCIYEAEHFLYANGKLKDRAGEPILLGSKLELPCLDGKIELLELKADDEGCVYFFNHHTKEEYDVHFLGSSELKIIEK